MEKATEPADASLANVIGPLLNRGDDPRDVVAAISAAALGVYVPRAVSPASNPACHVRFKSLKQDLRLAQVRVDPAPAFWDHGTENLLSNDGCAVLDIAPSGADAFQVHLDLVDGTPLTFGPFGLSENTRSETVFARQERDGVALSLSTLPSTGGSPREPSKRQRRLTLAVAGSRDRLEEVVPFVARQRCFRLRLMLVAGRRSPTAPRGVNVARLDRNLEKHLKGVQVLLDFSGSPHVARCQARQGLGKSEISTVIRSDPRLMAADLERYRALILRGRE